MIGFYAAMPYVENDKEIFTKAKKVIDISKNSINHIMIKSTLLRLCIFRS